MHVFIEKSAADQQVSKTVVCIALSALNSACVCERESDQGPSTNKMICINARDIIKIC